MASASHPLFLLPYERRQTAELHEIQSLVAKIRRERGFTMDPVRIFALLTEEVGEIASELKRTWSPNYEAFSKQDLACEIADALTCLLALANQFDIDLEKALMHKLVHRDGQRTWKSADRALEGEP
jgi:NTP pyrophosphatase (non-canonical NTP hydrolase)